MICELLMSKEDGKYVLMKDPNKPIVSSDVMMMMILIIAVIMMITIVFTNIISH